MPVAVWFIPGWNEGDPERVPWALGRAGGAGQRSGAAGGGAAGQREPRSSGGAVGTPAEGGNPVEGGNPAGGGQIQLRVVPPAVKGASLEDDSNNG